MKPDCYVVGGTIAFLTGLIVCGGMLFAAEFLTRQSHPYRNSPGLLDSFSNWDGVWYEQIASGGYSYQEDKASTVAFFPAFPVIAALVSRGFGISEKAALVVVANVCFVAALILGAAYVRERYVADPSEIADWVVISLALWPTSFFFRMAYSESLFILILLVFLYGVEKRWSLLVLASIVGLATACRVVGVALLPPLYLCLWNRLRGYSIFHLTGSGIEKRERTVGSFEDSSNRTEKWTRQCAQFVGWGALLAPLSCWGILSYMAYQQATFGDGFAFVKTQENWAKDGDASWGRRLGESLILKPIWSKYQPSSPHWWGKDERVQAPIFSLDFANPILFVATVLLVAYGAWRRELNPQEVLLAAGLLAIPYFTHGHRAMMGGHARFALVVFPAFMVLGRILYRLPPTLSAMLLAVSAFCLSVYSALFAAWYRFF